MVKKSYLEVLKEAATPTPKVKLDVEHPGLLEVPEGKDIEDLPESHFQNLIKKKGWSAISKGLINLKIWNRKKNPTLSRWADNMQEKLSKWVEKQREKNPDFGE